MQPHRGDDMDEMAEDYDMGDVEDDMYEEFQGRGLGDSDSDDEEYGPLVCLSLFQHYFEVVFSSRDFYYLFCNHLSRLYIFNSFKNGLLIIISWVAAVIVFKLFLFLIIVHDLLGRNFDFVRTEGHLIFPPLKLGKEKISKEYHGVH